MLFCMIRMRFKSDRCLPFYYLSFFLTLKQIIPAFLSGLSAVEWQPFNDGAAKATVELDCITEFGFNKTFTFLFVSILLKWQNLKHRLCTSYLYFQKLT